MLNIYRAIDASWQNQFGPKNTKQDYIIMVAMQKWHIIAIQWANNVAKYAYTSSVFGINDE